MDDLLIVFNTFGAKDNSDQYINSITSILSNSSKYKIKVVISLCCNSKESIDKIFNHFGNRIGYCITNNPFTVNITFNLAVKKAIEKYGEFKGYLYVDSGVDFIGQDNAIDKLLDSYFENNYGMLTMQVNNDSSMKDAGLSDYAKGKDHLVPIGGSYNAHVDLYSPSILKAFNKLMPDVFWAYCTESTYSFICAAINTRWAILKDVVINHIKSLDGASSGQNHISPIHRNGWNNLINNRNALDFINNKEALDSGLGYAESDRVMLHKAEAYNDNGLPNNPDKLKEFVKKYFYLSEEEIDYTKLPCIFI